MVRVMTKPPVVPPHGSKLEVPVGDRWELFAAVYADRRLHDDSPLREVNNNYEGRPTFGVTWNEWIAFLEGVCGHPYPSPGSKWLEPYNAGILAAILLDERHTYAARVYEFVASGRRWRTVADVAKALFDGDASKASYYLRHLAGEGFLEVRSQPYVGPLFRRKLRCRAVR